HGLDAGDAAAEVDPAVDVEVRVVAAFHVDAAAHVQVAADVDHVVPGIGRVRLAATGRHRVHRLDGRGGARGVVLVADVGGHPVAPRVDLFRAGGDAGDAGVQFPFTDRHDDVV